MNSFGKVVYVGAPIPKPTKVTFITQVDTDGFRYLLGTDNSKKVFYKDLDRAILELAESVVLNRQWFNDTFEKRAKSNPCNYTTIGGILMNMKLAHYDKGVYKYKLGLKK